MTGNCLEAGRLILPGKHKPYKNVLRIVRSFGLMAFLRQNLPLVHLLRPLAPVIIYDYALF